MDMENDKKCTAITLFMENFSQRGTESDVFLFRPHNVDPIIGFTTKGRNTKCRPHKAETQKAEFYRMPKDLLG
jgi:hypothetical protein